MRFYRTRRRDEAKGTTLLRLVVVAWWSSFAHARNKALLMIASSDPDDVLPSGYRTEIDFGDHECAVELTTDGNLVVQKSRGGGAWTTKWESGSGDGDGNATRSYYVHLQERHGNLVIYEGETTASSPKRAVWSTNTGRQGTVKLYVTGSCDLQLEGRDQKIDWTTAALISAPSLSSSAAPSTLRFIFVLPTLVPARRDNGGDDSADAAAVFNAPIVSSDSGNDSAKSEMRTPLRTVLRRRRPERISVSSSPSSSFSGTLSDPSFTVVRDAPSATRPSYDHSTPSSSSSSLLVDVSPSPSGLSIPLSGSADGDDATTRTRFGDSQDYAEKSTELDTEIP